MKIELKEITVSELYDNYTDSGESGVIGYGGKLDIRPPYQREFVYNEEQRYAVIDSIINEFPLDIMYWSVKTDGNFEIIDGQQRTVSICQFLAGDFSIIDKSGNVSFFYNLKDKEKEQILEYKLMIYFCTGTDTEKLSWFKRINTYGEKLTNQELLNAVYSGSHISDAKRYFSKTGCVAYSLGKDYVNGSPIRQDFLETVIDWINKGDIKGYMAKHQHDANATALWLYFENVITWVKKTFTTYRREMKGINWGELYNAYKTTTLNATNLEKEIARLMEDEDVTNKKGIYYYVLDNNKYERNLNIRAFSDKHKREAFQRQKGICPKCQKQFKIEEMEADHKTPWHLGGPTIASNCQMLCKKDNRTKSGI